MPALLTISFMTMADTPALSQGQVERNTVEQLPGCPPYFSLIAPNSCRDLARLEPKYAIIFGFLHSAVNIIVKHHQ